LADDVADIDDPPVNVTDADIEALEATDTAEIPWCIFWPAELTEALALTALAPCLTSTPDPVVLVLDPIAAAASTTVTALEDRLDPALIAPTASTTVTALAVVPTLALIAPAASTTVTALEVTPALALSVDDPKRTRMAAVCTAAVAAIAEAPSCKAAVE
jgi:hypothetical protein